MSKRDLGGAAYEGRVDGRSGARHGRGRIVLPDGGWICGLFVDDELHGAATVTNADGSWLACTYERGRLAGAADEFDADGFRRAHYVYPRGRARTRLRVFYRDGGSLSGRVDGLAAITGRAVYTYPDGAAQLVGMWQGGQMVCARFRVRADQPLGRETYRCDVSTATCIARDALLPEPYEAARVRVGRSRIFGAGEGLFAARDLPSGELVSFYNGVRLSHGEVDGRDWALNDNTITLDEDVVLDVPAGALSTTAHYCASLGHKANHAFDHNAVYAPCEHPRFGRIKALRTVRAVAAGEEVTVHYGYDDGASGRAFEAPGWYRALLGSGQ